MNKQFVKIGEKLRYQMTNINHKTHINFLGKQVFSVYLRPPDNQEIIEIITCFNICKSSGYIDISTIFIKEAKYLIASFSANLFNV